MRRKRGQRLHEHPIEAHFHSQAARVLLLRIIGILFHTSPHQLRSSHKFLRASPAQLYSANAPSCLVQKFTHFSQSVFISQSVNLENASSGSEFLTLLTFQSSPLLLRVFHLGTLS
mmetsp:Transcript_5156/g.19333  ORF Transcript_5156/g.19333 Transcript_5156/m.19333 type:complete len:116 (+) Transcript_5156:368-715(+)